MVNQKSNGRGVWITVVILLMIATSVFLYTVLGGFGTKG